MSILGIIYLEKHKCSTQYNLIGIAGKFCSVYSLVVRNSLTAASFTSRKYLPTINLYDRDLFFCYEIYIGILFISFINLYNLFGIAEMLYSVYTVSVLQELLITQLSLFNLNNSAKMTLKYF